MLTERVQVRLEPEQRKRLERVAKDRGLSVGALVREAIVAYVDVPARRSRANALATLERLGAPVSDWSTMKEEIARGPVS